MPWPRLPWRPWPQKKPAPPAKAFSRCSAAQQPGAKHGSAAWPGHHQPCRKIRWRPDRLAGQLARAPSPAAGGRASALAPAPRPQQQPAPVPAGLLGFHGRERRLCPGQGTAAAMAALGLSAARMRGPALFWCRSDPLAVAAHARAALECRADRAPAGRWRHPSGRRAADRLGHGRPARAATVLPVGHQRLSQSRCAAAGTSSRPRTVPDLGGLRIGIRKLLEAVRGRRAFEPSLACVLQAQALKFKRNLTQTLSYQAQAALFLQSSMQNRPQ